MVNAELVETVYLTISNLVRFDSRYAWIADQSQFDPDDVIQDAIVVAYDGGMFGESSSVGEIAKRALNRAIGNMLEEYSPQPSFVDTLADEVDSDRRIDQRIETIPGKARPRITIGVNRRSSYAALVTCPMIDLALCRLRNVQWDSAASHIGRAVSASKPSRIASTDDLRKRREEEFGLEPGEEEVYGLRDRNFGTPFTQWASYGVHFAFEHIPDRSLYVCSDWTDEEVERWVKNLDFDFCK